MRSILFISFIIICNGCIDAGSKPEDVIIQKEDQVPKINIPMFVSSVEEAQRLQNQTGKEMIVVAASTTCHWCKKFKDETLTELKKKKGDEIIVCYTYEITQGVRSFPTFWIHKGKGQKEGPYIGFKTYEELIRLL